jgi:hypothetical protein
MGLAHLAVTALACTSCGRWQFQEMPARDAAVDASPCVTSSDCDDHEPCTDDRCDMNLCVHTAVANGTTCDDGLGCGVCWAAVCQTRSALPVGLGFGGTQRTIEDGNGAGTGFTHLIPSTSGSYLPGKLDLSGGLLSVVTTEGDFARRSSGTQNDQDNPLALRFDATGSTKFRIAARLVAPWDLDDDYQNAGVLFGVSEDDYVKLVVMHHSVAFGGLENDDPTHTGFHLGIERSSDPGKVEEHNYVYSATTGFQGVSTVELDLEIDPAGPTATGCVRVDGGAVQVLVAGLAIAPVVQLFEACSYAAIVQTSNDYTTASAGGDPANSPWHPHIDAFAVTRADTDGDGLTLCDGDPDEPGP